MANYQSNACLGISAYRFQKIVIIAIMINIEKNGQLFSNKQTNS